MIFYKYKEKGRKMSKGEDYMANIISIEISSGMYPKKLKEEYQKILEEVGQKTSREDIKQYLLKNERLKEIYMSRPKAEKFLESVIIPKERLATFTPHNKFL
jgi:hypothetical protein